MEAPNEEAAHCLRSRTDRLLHPPSARPEEALPDTHYDLLSPLACRRRNQSAAVQSSLAVSSQ